MPDSSNRDPIVYGFLQPDLWKIYLFVVVVSGFFLSISVFQFFIVMSDPGFHAYPFKSDRVVLGFISGGLGFFVILGGIGAIVYEVVNDVLQNRQ